MNKLFKYTDFVCTKCGNRIVVDYEKGEAYCLKCSLVIESDEHYKKGVKYERGRENN